MTDAQLMAIVSQSLRRRILLVLQNESVSATELAKSLDIALSRANYHLCILANQGVVPAFAMDSPTTPLHLKPCDLSDRLLRTAKEVDDLRDRD